MTVEEIKEKYNMRDILEKYGMTANRSGFCKCPFHDGDRHASMKIYDDSFYCFGCGKGGDIFRFIQNMDKCDFKTAFYSLGGTYEHDSQKASKAARIARYRLQKAREQREKEQEREAAMADAYFSRIDECREKIEEFNMILKSTKPYSNTWCMAAQNLPYWRYTLDYLLDREPLAPELWKKGGALYGRDKRARDEGA